MQVEDNPQRTFYELEPQASAVIYAVGEDIGVARVQIAYSSQSYDQTNFDVLLVGDEAIVRPG